MLRWVPLISVCVIAGCSVLGPDQDRTRFFTLNSLVEPATDATHESVAYGLGPIKLPAYLNRAELATRVSPTEIVYSETDYWAAPLSDNVSAVLISDLSRLLGTDRIVLFPWSVDAVNYQVQITVTRLDCDTSGQCRLDARWWVNDARDGRILATRDTELTRVSAGKGSASDAAALSDALGALSQEVATVLRALPPAVRKS